MVEIKKRRLHTPSTCHVRIIYVEFVNNKFEIILVS